VMRSGDLAILYVTSHLPHGPRSGAQVRVLNLGRQLQQIGRVSLMLVTQQEIEQDALDRTRGEFNVKYVAKVNPKPLRGWRDRVKYELAPSYINTRFTAASDGVREDVLRIIGEHDVVWVHSVLTANELAIYRWPHTVLDVDDVQSKVHMSSAIHNSNVFRAFLDLRLSLVWRRRERRFLSRFDALTVCSDEDQRFFGNSPRVHVVKNGFNRQPETPNRSPASPVRVGFIGHFQHLPNRRGVEWFVRSVWPRLKREAPDARLRLIGFGSQELADSGPDVDGLGVVEDPNEEFASWSVMIVPIRFGSGTRVKIAEAFSRKCPVVSTSFGASGYGISDGNELLLADRPEDFARACIRLLRDRALGERLAVSAFGRFQREWTWDSARESIRSAVYACAK
jgi:glycosyltransferase involved in cell wall biosynthesis